MSKRRPIRIEIPGDPIPWTRPGQNKKKRFDTQGDQKRMVGLFVKTMMVGVGGIFKGPVSAHFQFLMPIPKYKEKNIGAILNAGGTSLHIIPPDTSNLIKFYEDALNDILWKDDCLICSLHGEKFYSLKPATVIEVEGL
jgi:Holliday junction resolvase RusA-like endonuclease